MAGAGPSADGIPDKPDGRVITHVLNRIAFGPRPGDVDRVRAMGLRAYIDQQLHPERIDDSAVDARLATFDTLKLSPQELTSKYFAPLIEAQRRAAAAPPRDAMTMSDAAPSSAATPERAGAAASPALQDARRTAASVLDELTRARLLRATLSDRQLEEVLTDFWLNHFNVYSGKGVVREYLTAYERDVIRPHVLGHFRDLLGAVAHSPAMLFYLDNWQSASPDAPPSIPPDVLARLNDPRLSPVARQRAIARLQAAQAAQAARAKQAHGLNENYARELMELHTLGVDGGYTQDDVVALARIFTGWSIDRPRQGGGFIFHAALHDNGVKRFLGVTFAPQGEAEGERALDLLARHPATARHLAYELAQRFVADDPPAALVDRAARTYLDTKGDLREVVRTIITSPEFFAPSAYRAKIKTPLELVVSTVRTTGADIVDAQPMATALRALGMPLYGCEPPTGYADTADAWLSAGSLVQRLNVAADLVGIGRPSSARSRPVDGRAAESARGRGRAQLGSGPPRSQAIHVDVTSLAPDVSAASREHVIDTLLAGDASDATRAALAGADRPDLLVALALGSPEFQRR
jgi:uncharacterized protein (DUF1800 family)